MSEQEKNQPYKKPEQQPEGQERFVECPHCGAAPAPLSFNGIQFPNGAKAIVFFCANCSKLHNVQMLTLGNTSPSRIIVPDGSGVGNIPS